MRTVIKNLRKIYTSEGFHPLRSNLLDTIKIYSDCDIEILNGYITRIEPAIEAADSDDVVDAEGGIALPGFIDAHTHPIYAGTREREFTERMRGKKYEKILAEGGGINYNIARTRAAGDDELRTVFLSNALRFARNGITAFEAKTGYDLGDGELRLLKILNDLKRTLRQDIRITFLGGHVLPKGENKKEFIDSVKTRIINVAGSGLADYFDVWAEHIAFTNEEAEAMIKTASEAGLKVRIHANELSDFLAVLLLREYDIASIDHFDFFNDEQVELIVSKGTNVTLLPLTQFSLGTENYPDARRLIDADVTLSLSCDFNPGTSYSANIQFLAQLALLKCGMRVNEILNALTINPACSLEMQDLCGTLEIGKQGDAVIMDLPNLESMFYSIAGNDVLYTVKKGNVIYRRDHDHQKLLKA